MLILDIQEAKIKERKRIFRKQKINAPLIERHNFKYNNKIHTVVTIPENMLESEEFLKLIKVFKGQVIACDDPRINDIVEQYRFDTKQYFKQAVFSSLYNIISSDKNVDTICIKDESIIGDTKLFELVRICKNVIFETENTIALQRFCDECYINYGAFVRVTEYYKNKEYGIYLNTSEIDSEGKATIFVNGKESIIYPDPSYFCCDEKLKEFLKYKIPIKTLCAAFNECNMTNSVV